MPLRARPGEIAYLSPCLQGPFVEPGGLDVRVDLPRLVARDEAVAPGPLVVAGFGVVKCERADVVLSGGCHDRVGDAGVEHTPPTKRKPLIGGIPDQRVPKPELPVEILPLDKLAKSFPDVRVELDLALERASEKGGIDARAEDGRVAKHRAVGRGEAIDVCCDDRLHGVGQ